MASLLAFSWCVGYTTLFTYQTGDGNFILVSLFHSQLQEILSRPSVNYIKK